MKIHAAIARMSSPHVNTTDHKRKQSEYRTIRSSGQQQDMIVRGETVDGMRSDIDSHRKRAAYRRTQELLNREAGEKHQVDETRQQQPLTVRQAAVLASDYEKAQKQIYKDKLHESLERHKPGPKLCVRPGCEAAAQSTRKKKSKTPVYTHDPESIAGMKYQWELDREKLARAKALRLLDNGSSWATVVC